jgi:hypothetical protein
VRLAPVDDVRGGHAVLHALHAGRQLGPHAAGHASEPGAHLGGGGLPDPARLVRRILEPRRNVGQEDRLVGAHRDRDRGGRLVGVDVVRLALVVGPDRRDHRDVVLGDVVQHVDVDVLDPAHETDVLVAGSELLDHAEQQPVVAGESDGRLPGVVQSQHDVRVLLPDQHHLRDLHRGGVRHAQALDELDAHAEALHVVRDLGPPAVHHDRVHPDVLQEHHVAREVLAQPRVRHRRSAVLDHDGLPVELPDVRKGLEEGGDVSHEL